MVVSTPIGRIGLALGEELQVPEVFGTLSVLRADIVASPTGAPSGVTMQEDPKLFNQPYPPDTPFAPMAAAKLGQNWVVMSRLERRATRFGCGFRFRAGNCDGAAYTSKQQERDSDSNHDSVARDMVEPKPTHRRTASR